MLQALVEWSRDPRHHDLRDCIRGIFFFGTPHHGLRTTELYDMVDEESDLAPKIQNLLAQLSEGSEFLENQKEYLSQVWKDFHGKVCTFYETEWTKTVKKVSILGCIPSTGNKCRIRFSWLKSYCCATKTAVAAGLSH
jgi:hypothetical protein